MPEVSKGLTTAELGDGLVPGDGILVNDGGVVAEDALETGLLRVKSRTQSKLPSAARVMLLLLVDNGAEVVMLVFRLVLQLLPSGLVTAIKHDDEVVFVLMVVAPEKLDALDSELTPLFLQLRETGCVSGT